MSKRIPSEVAVAIKKIVFDRAEKVEYLSISRPQASAFLDDLVADQDVGVKIAKYVSRDKARHYIKDAILNRYSKDKMKEAVPYDISSIVKRACNLDVEESHSEDKLSLYKSTTSGRQKEYVVVVEGTYLKWETALKKALLFISANPFSSTASDVHILLLLFAQHRPIPPSDKRNLENAIRKCDAFLHIFGERH